MTEPTELAKELATRVSGKLAEAGVDGTLDYSAGVPTGHPITMVFKTILMPGFVCQRTVSPSTGVPDLDAAATTIADEILAEYRKRQSKH